MANEKEKVKIGYSLHPVVIEDENGKQVVVYKKYHPITTGNAVVVGRKTLTNKLKEYCTKDELNDKATVQSVNGKTGAVVITASELGALTEHQDINGKVDKVEGKQLSTEDFTTALKNKLNGLENYDDSVIRGLISTLQESVNTLTGSADTTQVIDTFNEVIAFLNTFKNDTTLVSVLSSLKTEIQTWVGQQNYLTEHQSLAGKQDVIEDLDNIRSGASAGSTAVQPAAIDDMETKTHAAQTYQPKGSYLTEHQSLAGKQDKITETNKLPYSLISGTPSTATQSAAGTMSADDKKHLDALHSWFTEAVGNDGTKDAIDKWKEVEAFLAGITDEKTLTGILSNYLLKSAIQFDDATQTLTITI